MRTLFGFVNILLGAFMTFGQRLKLIRGNLKQEEFATKCGLHKNTVGRWERDEQTPNIDDTNHILATFPHINPAWLLTGEGEMKRGEAAPGHQETAPELDLELMEGIIIRTIKAQRSTGVDHEDLVADGLAIMTATSIINQYRSEKGLPSPSSNEILNNYNKMFAALNEKLTAMADKRDKEREG